MHRIKKINLLGLLVVLMFVLHGPVQAAEKQTDEAQSTYFEAYIRIVHTMKREMEEAPKTGDVSIDFLYEMVPHHKAAIQMSQSVLEFSQNPKIRKLAEAIIHEQTIGIEKMQGLLAGIKDYPHINKEKEALYLQASRDIQKQMVQELDAVQPSGHVDKDFLEGMLPHHEGAVKLATNILKHTDHDLLKKIAQHIVASQNRQMKQMKQLLKNL